MIRGLGGVGDWVGDGCLGWGEGYSTTRARLVNHHGRSKYKRFPCNFFENPQKSKNLPKCAKFFEKIKFFNFFFIFSQKIPENVFYGDQEQLG